MDVMITVNLWFIVALCFLSLIVGLLMGGGGGGGRRRYRW
jgi:hypothetical protein